MCVVRLARKLALVNVPGTAHWTHHHHRDRPRQLINAVMRKPEIGLCVEQNILILLGAMTISVMSRLSHNLSPIKYRMQ
jgi:hypothetical protein